MKSTSAIIVKIIVSDDTERMLADIIEGKESRSEQFYCLMLTYIVWVRTLSIFVIDFVVCVSPDTIVLHAFMSDIQMIKDEIATCNVICKSTSCICVYMLLFTRYTTFECLAIILVLPIH